ncbi:PREDICTED: gamma-tubulin complex component 2-like [Amphimedon queenslandica]|uniref:Gamma-tubulin complex component n=1 Tax=Amphimedon queenslandica TaxID=400682 RepID=A0A1X7UKI6_AMPQE|nr:PREDICTED: gamma-tubulin complex component 2-like [Amphimedon queenslandica]|eukprot:XP_019853680.1 PREDICTED: gamma-tubulin complex component 2-like [Amphimedon queenslandica]
MSHEFKIHHLTSQLLQLLQLRHLSPDTYNDTLISHMTPYVTTQISVHTSLRKISEHSSKREEFLQRYSTLKIKQPRELDPLVYLLAKLTEDPKLCDFIRRRRPPSQTPRVPVQVTDIEQIDVPVGVAIPELPPQDTKLTHRQLELLKNQLSSFTSKMEEADKKKKQRKEGRVTREFPYVPPWVKDRVYLTSDYVYPPLHSKLPPDPLGGHPLSAQQEIIMNELLNLMQGINGRYLFAKQLKEDQKRAFTLDRTLDTSLQSLLHRLLPLCTHYSLICRFIEEHSKFTHGTVHQALSASMRGLVREYLLVVAQLETQLKRKELTLQKIWYYLQPCMHTLELLAHIADTISRARHCHGGRTLSLLHDITSSLLGDKDGHKLSLYVTKCACSPFFRMLDEWLVKGEVSDPYGEFMISEDREIDTLSLREEYNDYYWERRYTASQENLPVFLEVVAEKILQTGKYLNVVRTCGQDIESLANLPSSEPPAQLEYNPNERYYIERIGVAYGRASSQVLKLLITDNHLLQHLTSIKHYFLIDQGDLFVHFMDIAEDELQKPVSMIPLSRLESLMELALRTSIANSDPYKDNLSIKLEPYNLKMFLRHVISVQPEQVEHGISPPLVTRPPSSTALPGYECVSLDYEVKWPLSLVLNRRSITRYQLLFRHLFFCKYVERELTLAWKDNKNKQRSPTAITPGGVASFALLQRMLNFVQGLQYYMCYEVLEPNCRHLESKLARVVTIDEVLALHTDFLDRCLKDCLLTNREVVELTNHLLQCSLTYGNFMQELSSNAISNDVLPEVAKYERNFTRDLSSLLSILNEMSKVESERAWSHMITRLDYNSFYTVA